MHWVLSGGIQRRALPQRQSKERKILNISFPREGIDPISCRVRMYIHFIIYHNFFEIFGLQMM